MIKAIDVKEKDRQEKQEKWDAFGMGVFLVVLGAGTLLAAWLLFQEATKKSLVDELATAARQGDFHVLQKHTDWDSVRNWLKTDLKKRSTVNTANTAAARPDQVDQIVDYYVRPDNLPSLLYYYNANAGHVSPEAFVRDVRFSGITQVTVEIAAPPQFDKPWLNNQPPVRAVFDFDLKEMGWKLKKLDAPDYLIPTRVPNAVVPSAGAARG